MILSPPCHKRTTRYQRGGIAIKILLGIFLTPVLLAAAWYAFASLRLTYWDNKVREMCEKEGGVQVFERVPLRNSRYFDADGSIRIPLGISNLRGSSNFPYTAKADDLFSRRITNKVIRKARPLVTREDIFVVRGSDKKILSQLTTFGRVGGDPIVIDFESRFICPFDTSEIELYKKTFMIENKQGDDNEFK